MPRLPLLLMLIGLLAGLMSLPGAGRASGVSAAAPSHHAMMQHDHAAMADPIGDHQANHDSAAQKCAAWCLASLLSLPAEPYVDAAHEESDATLSPALQARLTGRDLAPGLEPPIPSFA
ncbi:hypothetical protein [Rhizobium sp. FKL33]|uniref:hypothetical protein n=1 Tax=Rhizobium sp. FKL33 TaxID=2562307 RepID=UPI0010BF8499|nr:hypothetical protein [Rhizobium sp. FKL33]